MVQLLGFPVGAEISWSNRLVGAGDSVKCCPVRAGIRCRVVQLELDVLCCDIQLELDDRLVNSSIKA
jgi:hypothetical protein